MNHDASVVKEHCPALVRGKVQRPLFWVLGALVLGLVHLWLTIGPGIVLASNPFWRFPPGDIAMNVLGAESFIRDPSWHFPLAVTSGLVSSGQLVSIVFTDSAPWIAIAIKALHADQISIMGVVVALAVVAQPVALMLLLLSLGIKRPENLLIGTILGSLLPAWYMRLGMHIALASHWVIILALAAAVSSIRKGLSWWTVVMLAGLASLSFGIHLYLFAMVVMIAAAGLLANVARDGITAARKAAAGFAVLFVCSALSAWMLLHGPSGGVGGFGNYSMNLMSPVFPQRSGIAEMISGHSGRIIDATSGQYEGYNYFGAGILLCLLIAGSYFVRNWPAAREYRAALPLLLALIGLSVFALSNRIYFGHVLLVSAPLPHFIAIAFNAFRSSGRMFWPGAYMALAWAITAFDRLPRRQVAAGMLTAALLLQLLDTATWRRMLKDTYQPTSPPAFDLASLRSVAALRFVPAYSCTNTDHDSDRHVALVVERNGGVVEDGPIGRFDPSICTQSWVNRELTNPRTGQSDLLTLSSLPPSVVEAAKLSRRCVPIGPNLLCGAPA